MCFVFILFDDLEKLEVVYLKSKYIMSKSIYESAILK